MGFMSLEQFRTELQSAMGNRGFAPDRLDTWINMAYFELAGGIDFEPLEIDYEVNTVAQQAAYPLPIGAVLIRAVSNNTTKTFLRWISKVEYMRGDRGMIGPPASWTRQGNDILLYPVPDNIWAIRMAAKREPLPLSAAGDKTVLPRTWDVAIWTTAAAYGFMAVGEDQRAAFWRNVSTQYIQTRTVGDELQPGSPAIQPQISSGQGG